MTTEIYYSDDDYMDGYADGLTAGSYGVGYAEGKRAAYLDILGRIEDAGGHAADCGCLPCLTLRAVRGAAYTSGESAAYHVEDRHAARDDTYRRYDACAVCHLAGAILFEWKAPSEGGGRSLADKLFGGEGRG